MILCRLTLRFLDEDKAIFNVEKYIATEGKVYYNISRASKRLKKSDIFTPCYEYAFIIWCEENQIKEASVKLYDFALLETNDKLDQYLKIKKMLDTMNKTHYNLTDLTEPIKPWDGPLIL
jgi:hypothetical protein